MGALWFRYLFKEVAKTFLFFLFCFYLLYVVIDFSTHFQELMGIKSPPLTKVCFYYLLQFAKRAETLLPLALMLSAIKVTTQKQEHREWLAFRAGGLSQKKLLYPLFTFACLVALSSLAIQEYVLPYSLNFIDRFYDHHLRHSHRGNRREPIHVAHLEDHSKLIYQNYDKDKDAFFDVFLYENADDIWRIKYLYPNETPPRGEFVDRITRNEMGQLEKIDEMQEYLFPSLHWDASIPRKGFVPCENRSLSHLIKQTSPLSKCSYLEIQEALTHFLYKLTMPSLNLLCLIATLPFCVRFKRHASHFILYALSLFGLMTFIAFMDACVILGENATLSPYLSILAPMALLHFAFSFNYLRTVK